MATSARRNAVECRSVCSTLLAPGSGFEIQDVAHETEHTAGPDGLPQIDQKQVDVTMARRSPAESDVFRCAFGSSLPSWRAATSSTEQDFSGWR
jgi:hypothetical protein